MKSKKKQSLTAKQQAGVDNYCEVGSDTLNNADKSMRKAGYSINYARHRCGDWLANVGVKKAIAAKKAEISEKMEITRDRIIQGFINIAFQEGDTLGHQALKHRALQDLGKVKGIYEVDNRQKDGSDALEGLSVAEKDVLRAQARRLTSVKAVKTG